MAAPLYDIAARRIDGKPAKLKDYEGQVLLIVNVASKCGLTPQYDALEKLYEDKHAKGFAVLGFPANDFGAQEPGTNSEIAEFCETKFGVKFPMFEKIAVKGSEQHPLYGLLTKAQPKAQGDASGLKKRLDERGWGPTKDDDILWNFEKFLVSRDGNIVARFAPTVAPDDPALVGAVEAELKKS